MSDYAEIANEAERIAFLRLEKWLRELARKLPLSNEEIYIGSGLIFAVREAMGLPKLLGSCANAPPASEEEVEARRFGEIHLVKP